MPTMYIIAGPNGAGKTTASNTLLPEFFGVNQFVNADEIAKGLSPFAPESVSIESARIMLTRISTLIKQGESFGFETTLTTLTYKNYIQKAKEKEYTVKLLFLWLSDPEIAMERVKKRVSDGGHNIPPDVIVRRYKKGLKNLPLFLKMVDEWLIFDNSSGDYSIIAKNEGLEQKIYNLAIWKEINP
ncbi:MAG: zeta toxin family protein [Bacteroidetes bacterium]|nr:zeta toxin family protein [Bacteroidota bacterium]